MSGFLVIGRSGQLARALIEVGGYGLRAIGRPHIDIRDRASIKEALSSLRPDGVVNTAAYTAVDKAESAPADAFALNRDAPAMLADLCAKMNTPLVHVSTDYVFDGRKASPYQETDAKSPLGVYGRSKSEGEEAVLAAHPAAAVVRTAWVFSATGGNFVKTMLRLAAQGRDEVCVVADQHGQPTYAPDLARGTLAALVGLKTHGSAVAGVYHYAGQGETVWADFATAIFAEAAKNGLPSARVRPITTAEYPTPAARPANSRLDTGKFTATFGRAPQSWRDGLKECVERLAREA